MQSYFQNNDQMQYQRLLLDIQFYILLLLFPLFSSHILKDYPVPQFSNDHSLDSDGTYLLGYFRKMSLMTTMASCTT